jgi:hypothetical protein
MSSKKQASSRKRNTSPPEHPLFAEFWKAYPRREGKGTARKAFNAVIGNGTQPEILVSAAARYASHCFRTKTEQKYIAHPTTWLNQERWEDDYVSEPDNQDQAPPLPPWCGHCDREYRRVERDGGRVGPCPTCHPDAERNRT